VSSPLNLPIFLQILDYFEQFLNFSLFLYFSSKPTFHRVVWLTIPQLLGEFPEEAEVREAPPSKSQKQFLQLANTPEIPG